MCIKSRCPTHPPWWGVIVFNSSLICCHSFKMVKWIWVNWLMLTALILSIPPWLSIPMCSFIESVSDFLSSDTDLFAILTCDSQLSLFHQNLSVPLGVIEEKSCWVLCGTVMFLTEIGKQPEVLLLARGPYGHGNGLVT